MQRHGKNMVGKKAFKPTAADTRMCTQCRVIGRAVAVAEELLNEAGAPETFGFAASSSTGLAAASPSEVVEADLGKGRQWGNSELSAFEVRCGKKPARSIILCEEASPFKADVAIGCWPVSSITSDGETFPGAALSKACKGLEMLRGRCKKGKWPCNFGS